MRLITNDIDKDAWSALVKSSSTASFFQTPECLRFYHSVSFIQPFVFAVEVNHQLQALVCGYVVAEKNPLKAFFTRRAIIPGGVLLIDEVQPEALSLLLTTLRDSLQSSGNVYVEFRNYHDYSPWKSVFADAGFEYRPHLNYLINVKDNTEALQQLHKTKRRHLRLSDKIDVRWEVSTSLLELKAYYKILKNLYNKRIGLPIFPFEFFETLVMEHFGLFLVVKRGMEVIGGSICVVLPDDTIYEWFICGLDRKYKQAYPSTVATWAAIAYAAERGIAKYDMMGAGSPDKAYGVRDFKSKFGGELVEHGRFILVARPITYFIGRKLLQIIQFFKGKQMK